MKKITYIIVLSAVAVIFLSCGDRTAVKKVYQLEKIRAEARRGEEKMLGIKPELASKDDFQAVIAQYQNVFNYYKDNFPELVGKDSLTQEQSYTSYLAAESLLREGQLNLALGDTAAAKANFEEFETVFKRNLMQQRYAWLTLAQIYDKEHDVDKVEETYLKLIELEDPPADTAGIPDLDVLALPYNLAAFFKASENTQKAEHYRQFSIDYYKDLRQKYPHTGLWSASTRYLAETYRLAGKPRDAVSLLETATDSTGLPTRGAMMLAADIFFNDLNEPDSSIKWYRQVLDRGEDSTYTPRALMQMGQVQLHTKRYDQARATLNKVLDLDYAVESHPQAYRMIAISYDDQKQYDQALNNYQAIIENFPTHSLAFDIYLYLPEFFTKYGKKLLSDQWYNRAETFFMRKRDDFPEKPIGAAAQEYLARMYIKYEDWNNAIRALDKLAADYSRFNFAADAYYRIATIYESKLNKPDSARVYYQKQIEAYPGIAPSEMARKKIENT